MPISRNVRGRDAARDSSHSVIALTKVDSNPLILAIETATPGGSVCLTSGANVLGNRFGDVKVSHSNSLLRDIEDVLAEAEKSIADIDYFAVATGPGSFTGLRIGLATVKGLAATTGRLCIGVPTLQAVAHAAGPSAATVSLLPAGRGELFVQMFSVSGEREVKSLDEPAHLSPENAFKRYASVRQAVWAGEGARLYRESIETHVSASTGWTIASLERLLARNIAAIASLKLRSNEAVMPELLQAIYVRPSDAELNVANVVN